VLKVEHVIVCGHYGCGGVRAAYVKSSLGLIDNWLRHVQDVHDRCRVLIERGDGEDAAINRLCEHNVIAQVHHVCQTTIVQDAWRRKQRVAIHGWIYDLRDGLLRDLQCTATGDAEVQTAQTDIASA
jgi:carbonic anhydrase